MLGFTGTKKAIKLGKRYFEAYIKVNLLALSNFACKHGLSFFCLVVQPGQVEGDNPEEVKKQKAIKGLLNKITPEKFDKILADIIGVGYATEETESGLIDQVCHCNSSFLANMVNLRLHNENLKTPLLWRR